MEQEHLRTKIIKYTAVLVLISAVILVSSTIVVVAVRKAEEQEAIRSAWSGENAVSQVYEENGARVVTYAIPVYQGDVVKGALTGRRSSERRSAGRGLPIRFTALLWETTDGI